MQDRTAAATKLAIRDYWHQFRKDWKYSFPTVLLAGIGDTLVFYAPTLVIAKLLQRYNNHIIPSISALLPYLFALGGLWLLGEAVWRLTFHLMIRAESRAIERLYINGLRQLLKKDLSFFHENFGGSLTKRTVAYAKNYENVIDTLVFNIATSFFPLIFVCVILWRFSPLLALSLVAWTVLTAALITPLIRRRRKLVTVREAASNKLAGYIADIYSNVDAVKTYANEDFELSIHRLNAKDLVEKQKRSWDYHNQRIDTVTSPIYALTNLFGVILSLWVAKRSGAQIETVFITFSYYATFTRVMWSFNEIYRKIESAFSEAAQYTELLLDRPKLQDIATPTPIKITDGLIEFKDVTFQYDDADNGELFEKLNLNIRGGEKIGLVGRSGGGKSTLARLLMRLMDIDSGQILIDGCDISQVRQNDLRKYIAYVPQDPSMFHRSIKENITYARQDASEKDMLDVARKSHCDEFVKGLEHKYQTLIGERGVKLSGGQRQRVAIARAMLKNAPILVLDEATSALDSESEVLIQDALWKLMEDRTAIVIAHRLSTIQKMDRIIVLEGGAIAEQGTHKELLRENGIYAKLWSHQSGGFLED